MVGWLMSGGLVDFQLLETLAVGLCRIQAQGDLL